MTDKPDNPDASEPENPATAPTGESPAARIAAAVSPRVRTSARAEADAATPAPARPALFASSSYPGPSVPASVQQAAAASVEATAAAEESEPASGPHPVALESDAPDTAPVVVPVSVSAGVAESEPALDSAPFVAEQNESALDLAPLMAEETEPVPEPASLVAEETEPAPAPAPLAAEESEPATGPRPVVPESRTLGADPAPVPVAPGASEPVPAAPSAAPLPSTPAPAVEPSANPTPTPAPLHVAAAAPGTSLIPRGRRRRSGVLMALLGGAAGVVVAVIGVAVFVGVSGATSPNAGAAAVVRDYLGAIARSDASGALDLLAADPGDPALLTDGMLRASNAAAPLRDASVGAPVADDRGVRVVAQFRVGSDRVKHTFALSRDGNGDWRLASGTFRVTVDRLPGLALAVNGIPVSGGDVELFPGRYTLTTTTPNFTLGGRTSVVAGGSDAKPAFGARAELDDEGVALFRGIVRAGVEDCLASTALDAGCGLEVPARTPDGSRVVDGTVQRTLSADGRAKLAVLRPVVSAESALLVRADAEVEGVTVSMECVNSGRSGVCSTTEPLSLGTPLVDFSASPPVLGWG